jgi:hypothetical protein
MSVHKFLLRRPTSHTHFDFVIIKMNKFAVRARVSACSFSLTSKRRGTLFKSKERFLQRDCVFDVQVVSCDSR